jgi:hypothetical protein
MAKEIALTKGYVTLVDDEDYEWLICFNWHVVGNEGNTSAMTTFYNFEGRKQKGIAMHHMILHFPDCECIDHINRNTMDNRKSNLRPCTHIQNQYNKGLFKNNKTGYKGVRWDKVKKNYIVSISCNSKPMRTKRYKDIIEAAKAYDRMALRYHKEFAYFNFPIEDELDRILGGKL